MNHDNIKITKELVRQLIKAQFPQWSNLPITKVEPSGIDNVTFRLGKEMSVRLPSQSQYASQVQKEQKWLPVLAQYISLEVPKPIAMGGPTNQYPFNWSIYKWIDGESANNLSADNLDLEEIAYQLAQFLNELHKIDPAGGPLPGSQNFYRGGDLKVYDAETRAAIEKIKSFIDYKAAENVWETALSSHWSKEPFWVHGDLSAGNILVKDKKLNAVIDFGCMAVGDPACDLTICWTLLSDKSKDIFRDNINLDEATWQRARGWALWKALITLRDLDKASKKFEQQKQLLDKISSSN